MEIDKENYQPTNVVGKVKSSKSGKSNKSKGVNEKFKQTDLRSQILMRPDTYIGSKQETVKKLWVVNEEDKFVEEDICYVPGFYKIFDEILVNAADHKRRDTEMKVMKTLKVVVNSEEGFISVMNDGAGIPIEIHETGFYAPELIFAHLLTSSNYDDTEERLTGGRNGFGAKLTNIFSSKFIIETVHDPDEEPEDGDDKKSYYQECTANMTNIAKPKISRASKKSEMTRITFFPDQTHMGSMTRDMIALFKKRTYDMAGILAGVKVYWSTTTESAAKRIKISNFKQYVEAFSPESVLYSRLNEHWEIALAVSPTSSSSGLRHVSFVNAIWTSVGGNHVGPLSDKVATKVLETFKKGTRKNDKSVTRSHVKPHLWIFVNALIYNPSFDSQGKESLNTPASRLGLNTKAEPWTKLIEDFAKKTKSFFEDKLTRFTVDKNSKAFKKTDGTKKERVSGIAKLDDANDAGGRSADQCTLILTEGDSAKALAVSGLSVVGRNRYGVFPLRGKLLNVRDAAASTINKNEEIAALKQIMGLKAGKKYDNVKSLRYGSVMVMADQDHDGSHIKGLIINFFHHYWPSLLQQPGFLKEFITPIVKATKGKKVLSFYTMPEYEAWKESLENNTKGWTIKYYKGLGTSSAKEAKQYFKELAHHSIDFEWTGEASDRAIDLVFNKKKADERKEWLRQFKDGTFLRQDDVDSISIEDFVDRELVLFSLADNQRSIPSVVDGLKPGQRKILFAAFKRKLKAEIKVAQLAGYVSEHSAYHHGEASLAQTIIGMAQDFVGSNNISILYPSGQFGTRLQGGKDAASPRYVYTRLAKIARLLFHIDDDALLDYLSEDGQSIEPSWYLPIIPLVLVNGAEGIGTGWSTNVPNYSPLDIVDRLRQLLSGRSISDLEPLRPWYKGFTGTIEANAKSKTGHQYVVTGKITKIDDETLEISELPIKSWTQSYKEYLESLLTCNPPFIKDFKEHHTDTTVLFTVQLTPEKMAEAESIGLEKKFKMTSSVTTSNMVLFNAEGRIQKYANVEEILGEFYRIRLSYYSKRKDWLFERLTAEWEKLDNKCRFILAVIAGEIKINNRKKEQIFADLEQQGFDKIYPITKTKADDEGDEEADDIKVKTEEVSSKKDKGYDYLLSMPIWSLTKEKVATLEIERETKKEELDILMATPATQLWKNDLDEFVEAYEQILDDEAAEHDKEIKRATANQKRGKKKTTKKVLASKKKKAAWEYSSDSELDDFIVDSGDDSDDFFATKKVPVKKATVKKTTSSRVKPMLATKTVATSITAASAPAKASKKRAQPGSPPPKETSSRATEAPASPAEPARPLTLSERMAARLANMKKSGNKSASSVATKPTTKKPTTDVKAKKSPPAKKQRTTHPVTSTKSVKLPSPVPSPSPVARRRAGRKATKKVYTFSSDEEDGDNVVEDEVFSDASDDFAFNDDSGSDFDDDDDDDDDF